MVTSSLEKKLIKERVNVLAAQTSGDQRKAEAFAQQAAELEKKTNQVTVVGAGAGMRRLEQWAGRRGHPWGEILFALLWQHSGVRVRLS